MNELFEAMATYVSIWLPSAVAIIGTVSTVLIAISKIKTSVEELKKTDILKTLAADLKKSLRDNEELKLQNDILIDELKKIKNYRESKKNDK